MFEGEDKRHSFRRKVTDWKGEREKAHLSQPQKPLLSDKDKLKRGAENWKIPTPFEHWKKGNSSCEDKYMGGEALKKYSHSD